MGKNKGKSSLFFDKFATHLTKATGKASTFIIAFSAIILWGITGPIFKFSDTWQLVINTSTSVITFLMVFLIQQTQNKDTLALQLKVNELIAANKTASNRLIDIEDLTGDELEVIKKFYVNLTKLAQKEKEMQVSNTHSFEKASNVHKSKIIPVKPSK